VQRLNTQDALLAAGEAAGWPLQLAALQIYDAAAAPQGLGPERVGDLFRQRLPHLPVFRQRLVRVPGGLDRPVWVEDPEVDVAARIHSARVPAPGTDRQLAELAGDLHEPALDLSGPVWEVWVIEGLEGGRIAVLARLHHAAVDGVRALQAQSATLDLDPAAPFARPGGIRGAGEDAPGGLQLLTGAAVSLAGTPVRLVWTAGHLARAAGRLADAARRGQLAGLALPFTAPRTSLNGAVSKRRDYAFCSLSLAAVKAAAHQEHVTVNDVVLALAGGALRRYLDQRGELPSRSLTAAVPIGLPGDDMSQPGNRWAIMVVSLATNVENPVRRLHKIAASARAAKAAQRAVGPEPWLELPDVPPVMVAAAARGYTGLRLVDRHPTIVNVVVSSLRGAPVPLYFAGARLLANYPIGPVADGFGLNVTVVSYLDSLDFGLSVCPDLVADPWRVADALRAEETELSSRYVGRPRRSRGRPAPARPAPQ
jgi:diacylglycerol O-acyltransferase / wax synthase